MNHQHPVEDTGDTADPRLALSLESTEYALEQTFLAWMRTIITLILSGFALDKLVEVFHQSRLITGQALLRQAHIAGIVFSLAGILLLAIKNSFLHQKNPGACAAERSWIFQHIPGNDFIIRHIFSRYNACNSGNSF